MKPNEMTKGYNWMDRIELNIEGRLVSTMVSKYAIINRWYNKARAPHIRRNNFHRLNRYEHSQ